MTEKQNMIYDEVIGYIKYMIRNNDSDIPMAAWTDVTTQMSEHYGSEIEYHAQMLAEAILGECE